ncbi:MAG TPA: flagellar assembly protein FliW [Bacilli bacterium]|nr:flagellar assembly protein FliW [Bacilli bacterium]
MVKLETATWGAIEVAEADIFQFPDGLYGMEEQTRFALVRPDEELPFAYLQSTTEPGICLLIADPFAFYRAYEFDLSESDVAKLDRLTPEQTAVWVTMTAGESLQDATVNLLAPLVFNTEKRIGRQVVLHDSTYPVKAPLMKEGK